MLSNLESALQMRLPALHDAPRQSVRSDIVSWYQMALGHLQHRRLHPGWRYSCESDSAEKKDRGFWESRWVSAEKQSQL